MGVLRLRPEVIELLRVFLEVIKLSGAVFLIDNELIAGIDIGTFLDCRRFMMMLGKNAAAQRIDGAVPNGLFADAGHVVRNGQTEAVQKSWSDIDERLQGVRRCAGRDHAGAACDQRDAQ